MHNYAYEKDRKKGEHDHRSVNNTGQSFFTDCDRKCGGTGSSASAGKYSKKEIFIQGFIRREKGSSW